MRFGACSSSMFMKASSVRGLMHRSRLAFTGMGEKPGVMLSGTSFMMPLTKFSTGSSIAERIGGTWPQIPPCQGFPD